MARPRRSDSTLFTGFRIENRLRPLMREHCINPVLYVEYENTSGADKTILEVVGHDGQADLAGPNGEARREHQHEAELKLILSSNLKSWNISENFIAEKNLGHAAMGVRLRGGRCPAPAQRRQRPRMHLLRREILGRRGGLRRPGRHGCAHPARHLALHRPAHRLAAPKDMRLSFSPGFGLTRPASARVYRVGLAFELPQIGNWFHRSQAGDK